MLSDIGSIELLLVDSYPFEEWKVSVVVTGSCMVEGDRSPRENEVAVVSDDGEYIFFKDGKHGSH